MKGKKIKMNLSNLKNIEPEEIINNSPRTWTFDKIEQKESSIERYRQESIKHPYYIEDDPKYFKGTKEHRKMIKR